MNTIAVAVPPTSLLSAHELARASQTLISSRDNLDEVVSGLSDAQFYFKPTPGVWSIAENVEHLAILEGRVHGLLRAMPDAPAAEPDRDNAAVEELLLVNTARRDVKMQAPAVVFPSGQWSPAESLARFKQRRFQTLDLLTSAPCLRGHLIPHPLFGTWDGYQWIVAAAAHTQRHIDQILEVKQSPGFPRLPAEQAASLD